MKGKFITFEGGEGVGKSTQVKLLAAKLSEIGYKVHTTREPGGDIIGESIRSILKSFVNSMDPLCETLLLFAGRRDHYIKVIKPLLESGIIVICDRFYDSSLVYQGLLKKVSFEDIMKLKYMTIGDCEPDLTIILDMEAKISMQRTVARSLIPDAYDALGEEKHNLIRTGFKKIAEIFSFRTVLINAASSEEKVFEKIMKAVQKIGIQTKAD